MGKGIVQVRKGIASLWSSANTILKDGELGYDKTNRRIKVGDGSTPWNTLPVTTNTWIATSGTPSNSVGMDGDLAWDAAAKTVYGPKAAGVWPAGQSLQGPQGNPGSTGSTGPGVPTGGAADTFLAKIDATNYNTSWRTPAQVAALLPTATTTTAGTMSAADKTRLSNLAFGYANLLDYGGDSTGVTPITTPLNNAIAALPAGGVVFLPPGTYLENTAPYIVAANNITILGAGENATVLKTTNTTGDQLRVTGYGSKVRDIQIQGPGTSTTSSKTAGIGLDIQSTEGEVINVSFAYQASCLRLGGHLTNADGIFARYWTLNGIIVDHQSDHQISRVVMDNAVATLPTGAGIDVRVSASLVLDMLNIIHANWCLNLSPAAGVTIPSVKATNCFFDTSVIGCRMAGAGSVYRSEFTNCWFSSMSQYGVLMAATTAGVSIDGITWVNCDFYNNVGGTTTGIAVTTSNIGKWKMVGCTVAGWTVGIQLIPGASHFPTILSNTIGSVSAFGVNGTGISVPGGTYKGLVMIGNDVVDNTTAISLGAVSATAANYRIIDNAGINPRGTELRPVATPVAGTTYTNNTGFRVQVMHKNSAAPSAVIINGTTYTVAFLASQVFTVTLEPGGTIAFTGGTHTSWSWIGM